MNRVRRTSRKYAEIKGRPDHYRRVETRRKRTEEEAQRIMRRNAAKMKVVTRNQGKQFDHPTPAPAKKPSMLKRMFRRQGR